MNQVFILSLTAALNPTLVAASTVMLLLPSPRRLMFGYLLGALVTSITIGLVIVFALKGSGIVGTTQHTVSPVVDLVLGAIGLVAAFLVHTHRPRRLAERRQRRAAAKKQKAPPRWQRVLSQGSARTTFFIGAILTLPGASYLAGLAELEKQNPSTATAVIVVIAFNLIMLALLEIPLIGYTLAPEWTPRAIQRAKLWIGRRGRLAIVLALTVVGAALVIKGTIGLVS